MAPDYVMTIESDDEGGIEGDGPTIDPGFSFDVAGGALTGAGDAWDSADVVHSGSKPVAGAHISRRHYSAAQTQGPGGGQLEAQATRGRPRPRHQRRRGLPGGELGGRVELGQRSVYHIPGRREAHHDEDDPLSDSDSSNGPASEAEGDDTGSQSDSDADSDVETPAQKAAKAAYFAPSPTDAQVHTSFTSMNLSRPLLRALTSAGFNSPTPIQAATIPVALLGKDVVGGAVTGSGKTAAFIIPILERLLYRSRDAHTRVLVLVPTRELAVQCHAVAEKLGTFTDVRCALIVGGLSLKAQEATLRTRPDLVVATPGRLIDHLRNSRSFALDALDVLVLDEADRMLSDGFADELKEIVQSCPTGRQTMLFSATMTDDVETLIRLSLRHPVRLFVDPSKQTARGLVQEFVRVRAGKEAERPALLVALCQRTARKGVIIFFRSKKLAHQFRVVFGLCGLKALELHGNLTQEQRLNALTKFRSGEADYLLATDLASRGLDIRGIETVINYDMPGQIEQYVHRVGRTARAGKKGRSITLVGEADRKMLKAAIKRSEADKIRHRVVPSEVVASVVEKLEELKGEVEEVLKEEKEEKLLRTAEMELKKGQNMITHEEEIFGRPKRTWFQTDKEKEKAAGEFASIVQSTRTEPVHNNKSKDKDEDKPKRDKFSGLTRRAKRRKLAREADAEFNDQHATDAAIRSAKRAQRPGKIGEPVKKFDPKAGKKKSKSKIRKVGFDRDLADRGSAQAREGMRAKKGEGIKALKPKRSKGAGKKAAAGKPIKLRWRARNALSGSTWSGNNTTVIPCPFTEDIYSSLVSAIVLAAILDINDQHPSVHFYGGNSQNGGPSITLAKVPPGELRTVLGEEPLFGQGQHPGEIAAEDIKVLQSARWRGPNLVFLGVEEPSAELSTPKHPEDVRGTPYFALDATDISTDDLFGVLSVSESQRLEFAEPRSATAKLSSFACGSRTYPLWAGWKLSCTSVLPWAENQGKPPCPSSSGLNNYMHPRTDAVVITAVLDETGDRILLGRNFPSYSLLDAKWFTREEVLAVLAHPDGTNIRRREYKNFDEAQDHSAKSATAAGSIDPQPLNDQPPFRVPPRSAIAGVLISQWAKGEVPGLSSNNGSTTSPKGKI
ncbi:ATP-dependent RNA helicase drs1 [Rhizoctonia solani AG-1 IA]|uniref:RNA helicase n=1 Tax=Thanatephorus cucumeris (strain AG1-IA) TaxID=983506 RepID=L8WUK0_THACA|nr:ATP-dependent RNA helicase drs1 [Rhizoctonia solani AG-1 IA]